MWKRGFSFRVSVVVKNRSSNLQVLLDEIKFFERRRNLCDIIWKISSKANLFVTNCENFDRKFEACKEYFGTDWIDERISVEKAETIFSQCWILHILQKFSQSSPRHFWLNLWKDTDGDKVFSCQNHVNTAFSQRAFALTHRFFHIAVNKSHFSIKAPWIRIFHELGAEY